jgi:Na+/serine symporter
MRLVGYLKRSLCQNIQQRRLISFREERDENIILILGRLFVNMFKSYLTIHFFCLNNVACPSKVRKKNHKISLIILFYIKTWQSYCGMIPLFTHYDSDTMTSKHKPE